MQNVRLDESQAGIKITGRNINNLRYANDTPIMAESKERKTLFMKVKEESQKVGLKKIKLKKTKIMASSPITCMANRWGNNGNRERHFFGGEGALKSLQMVTTAIKLKDASSLEEKLRPT